MKRSFSLVAALAICNCAGTCGQVPPDSTIRTGMTPEELNKEPNYNEMKAAITSDVRKWRELDKKAETDGQHNVPVSVIFSEGLATCGVDKVKFEVVMLRDDPGDQPYRITETAYLCRKEWEYYYHYQGGPRSLDVWLGPYHIERKHPHVDDSNK